MKYTIEGFSQAKAIELNLDAIDLCILRWITDFANTDSMVKMQVENKIYFWVKYEGLLQELPILGIKKDSLYRRLKNMVEQGVLEHTTVKMGGTFSMYRFGERFIDLIANKEQAGGTDLNPIGYGNKSVGGTDLNPDQNNNLLNKNSSKTDNTLSTKEEQAPKIKRNVRYSNYGEVYTDSINSNIRKALEKFVKSLSAKHRYSPKVSTVVKFADSLRNLSSNNPELAMRIVDQSIDNGWKDLYKLKNRHSGDAVSTPFNPETDTLAKDSAGENIVY